MPDSISKSWFAVFNSPYDHGYLGEPSDLEIISELIDQGYMPKQIMDRNITCRIHENVIKGAYFSKLEKEPPFFEM